MVVFALCAVVGQAPNTCSQGFVARQHGAAIAQGTEVFAREEARRAHSAEHARRAMDALTAPFGSETLGVVLHDVQAVYLGPGNQGVHVGALAKQMHHHHRLGVRRARLFRRTGVELEGPRVDVCKHGRGADLGHNFSRGDEGEIGHDDLVTRPQSERAQGEGKGVCAVAAPHDVPFEPKGVVELGLKLGHVFASDERRGGHDFVEGLIQLWPHPCVQPAQIHHVNGLWVCSRLHGRMGGAGWLGHRRKAKIARTLAP